MRSDMFSEGVKLWYTQAQRRWAFCIEKFVSTAEHSHIVLGLGLESLYMLM
jgi:hypothetical protein